MSFSEWNSSVIAGIAYRVLSDVGRPEYEEWVFGREALTVTMMELSRNINQATTTTQEITTTRLAPDRYFGAGGTTLGSCDPSLSP